MDGDLSGEENISEIISNLNLDIHYINTKLDFFEWQENFEQKIVFFQIIKFINSYYVWIGMTPKSLDSLHMIILSNVG